MTEKLVMEVGGWQYPWCIKGSKVTIAGVVQ